MHCEKQFIVLSSVNNFNREIVHGKMGEREQAGISIIMLLGIDFIVILKYILH